MFSDLFYLFFPSYCASCDNTLLKNEKTICTRCRHELPTTDFHHINVKKIEKVFYGRIPIQNATALFYFRKDSLIQNLIHNLKYRGHEKVGETLGHWLGNELKLLSNYQNIDYVIPVPLHPIRLRERGYNQVEKFGRILATYLNATYVDTILKKNHNTSKQSKKNRDSRWSEQEQLFEINTKKSTLLENKHILLVDDIITTGATLEQCAEALLAINSIKISIATMAIAD